jgi:hypothetical protein
MKKVWIVVGILFLLLVGKEIIKDSKSEKVIGEVHHQRQRQVEAGLRPFTGQLGRLTANRYVMASKKVTQRILEVTDPNIIFFAGHPNERAGTTEQERINWLFLPIFLIGLIKALKTKNTRLKNLVFLWLVASVSWAVRFEKIDETALLGVIIWVWGLVLLGIKVVISGDLKRLFKNRSEGISFLKPALNLKKKTSRRYRISLGIILLLGLLIRVVGATEVGTGFYVDEASLGYNAKSIWETGKDEYGQRLPVAFRSFGDYKPPLFVYVAAPLVNIFGEVKGVRWTSALLGTVSIWLVAEIARRTTGGKVKKTRLGDGEMSGIFAGLFIATLPWHVNLSRHGIEAVLATSLMACAILALMSQKFKRGLLFLALSSLAYHSTRYIAPLISLGIGMNLWKNQRKIFQKNRLGWLLVGAVWAGVLLISIQPFTNTRASGVQQTFNVRNLTAAYVSYFSPRTLVLGDSQARDNVYGMSNMSIVMVMLFYIGTWQVVENLRKTKRKGNNFNILLLLTILFLAPLPASATVDPFHSIRALVVVVPMSVLAGIGAWWALNKLKTKQMVIVKLLVVSIFLSQFFFLIERILVQNKLTAYENWGGGYQQLVEGVVRIDTSSYDQVVVDTTDIPGIYSLWQVFGKVDTKEKIPLPNKVGYFQPVVWSTPKSLTLENGQEVFFRPIYWPDDQRKSNVLYIGSHWRFDRDALLRSEAETVVEIKDLTGKVIWMAVATKDI